jgi:hypothetical protein
MSIKQIFDEIAAESSTNQKMEIFKKYKDNKLLKRVLYLANSKRVKFFIRQLPEYTPDNNGGETLQWALDGLSFITNRNYSGNDAINWLITLLSGVSTDDAYIIERIIEKDCKIGMGTTFMNKVIKDLIEIHHTWVLSLLMRKRLVLSLIKVVVVSLKSKWMDVIAMQSSVVVKLNWKVVAVKQPL